jgi:hypothetical protein
MLRGFKSIDGPKSFRKGIYERNLVASKGIHLAIGVSIDILGPPISTQYAEIFKKIKAYHIV